MLYNPYSCSINLLHVHIYAGNYDRGEASLSLYFSKLSYAWNYNFTQIVSFFSSIHK